MYAYLAMAALQVVGGFQSADITRQNGELQNKIADMNAQFAKLDAFNARATGQTNAARYAAQIDQVQGADKAALAGSNTDVGYGTARDISADNKIAGMANVLQIQRAAQNKAAGLDNQAINIQLGGAQKVLQAGLDASAQEAGGIASAFKTGISGYDYDQSTGKGNSSRTGEDSAPTYDRKVASLDGTPTYKQDIGMWLTPNGQQVSGASTLRYRGGGWYPGSGGSFTDEVG